VKQKLDMGQRLIFLYDADSGILPALFDAGKRLMNDPSTCRLYRLTHGFVFEKRVWSDFLSRLPMPFEYGHREFAGIRTAPAVIREQDGGISVLVSTEDLEQLTDTQQLIKKIEAHLLTGFAE
jgi:hypothetical protein